MVGHNVYGLQGTRLKSEKEKGEDCTLSKESEKKFVIRNSVDWCMSQKDQKKIYSIEEIMPTGALKKERK